MATNTNQQITVEVTIYAPVEKVWKYFNTPDHVVQWNNASDEWFTPKAENDVRPGGTFNYRMEARDGSFGFDFMGVYDEVTENKYIAYTLGDGRKVSISFTGINEETKVVENFEAESTNPVEMQRQGWLAILKNFKHYVETN